MSEHKSHTSFLESCFETRKAVQILTKFRPALPPEDPKARFPGFRQRITVFKAGQQVQKGAKRLPVDLVMHECACGLVGWLQAVSRYLSPSWL